jgi:two-component system LytT family response regulator
MKAVIIDDEPLARMIVREYLQTHSQIEVAEECNDGFEGLKAIQQHNPDLLFLDIQMPKITGFEMLELLEQPPAVIFTTAFDEYALKAFDAHAVDYLLKPFSKERFDKAVERYLNQATVLEQKLNTQNLLLSEAASSSERIVVKTGSKIIIIPVHEIQYMEAADDYVKIFTNAGSYLKNKTMAFFENSLPPKQFVRTHRSYIVNVSEITRIDPYEKESHIALLKSGGHVAVSKSGYQKLRAVLGL